MASQRLRILLVDDDEDDYVLTRDLLSEIEHAEFDLEWLPTYEAAARAIGRREHDLYLIDYRLGERDGLKLLREARRNHCTAPMIVLTGQGDRQVDLEAMQAGAADYLVKGQITAPLLERSIRYAVQHARAEGALRESEERYRALVENASDVIYTHDLVGNYTSINKTAERLMGYTCAEAVAKNVADVIVPGSLKLAAEGNPETFELEIVTKHGQRVTLEARVKMMLEYGTPVGWQGIARDITERKRAEAELRKAKEAAEAASRLKSDFVATMSHELRTPLNIIMGFNSLLLDGAFGTLAAEQADALRRIDTSAGQLLELINSTLDLGRLEKGELPLELADLDVASFMRELREETRSLQEKPRVKFVWKVHPDLPRLCSTDPAKLKVILKNLIDNAAKFTEAGIVTVDAHRRNDGVEISVADTGIGIAPEALPIIFDSFRQADGSSTRKHGGVGLGLYIVRRLLDILGGSVTVESALGQGSTFHVQMPSRSALKAGDVDSPGGCVGVAYPIATPDEGSCDAHGTQRQRAKVANAQVRVTSARSPVP